MSGKTRSVRQDCIAEHKRICAGHFLHVQKSFKRSLVGLTPRRFPLLMAGLLLAFALPQSAPAAGTGAVAGVVTDASTSSPIQGAKACAYDVDPEDFDPGSCAETIASGQYTITGLASSSYKVEFSAPVGSNYARQFYSGEGDWDDATAVSVTEPSVTSNVDAQLKQGGRIAGRVTDSSTSSPIQDIRVCAHVTGVVTGEGAYDGCALTNANGEYLISGLATLYFELSFQPADDKGPNYVREYYDDKSFFFLADAVEVVAPGTTTTEINAALDPGGTITGTVSDEITSAPTAGVEVCAHEEGAQGDQWGCTHTNASGNYTMVGLASKQYRVRFSPPLDSQYLFQVYDGADRFYAGDLVAMAAPNTINGIDAHLRKEGSITGQVTDETTSDPIHGAWVCAFLEGFDDPEFTHCAQTNANGDYQVKRLPAGPYTIEFWASPQGYLAEYYDDETMATADTVTVAYGVAATGINAVLVKDLKPINTARPVITGTPAVGQLLSCSSGAWSNEPTEFAYQWQRESVEIFGATANVYTVQPGDQETFLECTVTATNVHGSAAKDSSSVFVPEDEPPEQQVLNVWKEGTGTGTVTSSPTGIDCGLLCFSAFDDGETVVLTASPDPGSYLAGWVIHPAVPACEPNGLPAITSCEFTIDSEIDIPDTEATAFFYKSEGSNETPPTNPNPPSGSTPPSTTVPPSTANRKRALARKRALRHCRKLKGKTRRRCLRKARQLRGAAGLERIQPMVAIAASLDQTCVRAGTAMPKILDGGPWLNHPGDRKTQTYAVEANYSPLSKECHGVFRRIPEIRFQIQNPTNHAQWINAGSYLSPMKSYKVLEEELEKVEQEREEQGESCWRPIPGGEKNICRIDPHIGDDGGIGEVFFHGPPARLHKPRYSRSDLRAYRCTPGKGITHVRALFKNTVTSVKTGKVVEQRIATVPVRVRSYPGKGPMPRAIHGAVRRAC